MDTAPSPEKPLFSPEFVMLSVIAFLAFCNISLFYGFNAYMEAIHIPPMWRGVLLGLEPGTAFLVRPVISPVLTVRNSISTIALGLATIMAALLSYQLTTDVWGLALVRVAHGLGLVLLISASVTLLVEFIPAGRSGQGFGIFTVASLLPYAVLPPIVESMLGTVGNEAAVYGRFTIFLLPALLLLLPLGRSVRRLDAALPHHHKQRPTAAQLRADLRTPGVAQLLAANLLLFTATTIVFFYMKDHLLALGSGNAGLFFTVSTGTTIVVRVVCGKLLDRVNRAAMLTLFLGVLAATLCLFGVPDSIEAMLPLAALYGMCLGFVMPQMNASMFVISEPRLRGLNTNLLLFTMDGGFFLGPLLAGLMQTDGMSLTTLFALCALGPLLAGALTWTLVGRMRDGAPRT
jgi:MFS family permease